MSGAESVSPASARKDPLPTTTTTTAGASTASESTAGVVAAAPSVGQATLNLAGDEGCPSGDASDRRGFATVDEDVCEEIATVVKDLVTDVVTRGTDAPATDAAAAAPATTDAAHDDDEDVIDDDDGIDAELAAKLIELSKQPKQFRRTVYPDVQQVDLAVDYRAEARPVLQWFPSDDEVVFRVADGARPPMTYHALHQQVLGSIDLPPGARIATLLAADASDLAAVVLLSVMHHRSAACPMDTRMTTEEIEEAVRQIGCSVMIVTPALLYHARDLADELDAVYIVRSEVEQAVGTVSWRAATAEDWAACHTPRSARGLNRSPHSSARSSPRSATPSPRAIAAAPSESASEPSLHAPASSSDASVADQAVADKDEPVVVLRTPRRRDATPLAPGEWKEALVLRTSGTTGMPKVVPIRADSLWYNCQCLVAGLGIDRSDMTLSAMPLFHVGGIMSQIMATLVAGASVMFAPSFDPASFLHQLEGEPAPTWYSAVPTSHKALLMYMRALRERRGHGVKTSLRRVRSGASHLNHADAEALREAFHAPVILTYGMSECMPIAITPPTWNLELPDTVGWPIGPCVRIADADGNALPYGKTGEVLIRGPGVMPGYERVGEPDEVAAAAAKDFVDGWLRTGDQGRMTRQGAILLGGRLKDVAKRGGEQVALHEVDEAVMHYPGVHTAVAFAVPNEFWGQEIAVAVVLNPDTDPSTVTTASVAEVAREYLDDYKVPRQVVVVQLDQLPKTRTGKIKRANLADVFGVSAVDLAAVKAVEAEAAMSEDDLSAGMAGKAVDDASEDALLPDGTKRPAPSKALYGVRFILACFVVQHHVGKIKIGEWDRLQDFTSSMTGFVLLAGFLMGASKARPIARKSQLDFYIGQWSASYPLYLFSTLYALPSFVGRCVPGTENCPDLGPWIGYMIATLVLYATGFQMIFAPFLLNPPTWFQSVYYVFVLSYPSVDRWVRGLHARRRLLPYLGFFILISSVILLPLRPLFGPLLQLVFHFTALSWMWTFTAGLMMWNVYRRYYYWFAQRPRLCGIATDVLSFLLLCMISVAAVMTCDVNGCYRMYVHDLDTDVYPWYKTTGRLMSTFSYYWGFGRLNTPLTAAWLFGLSLGQGYTARFLSTPVFVRYLSPLAYPVYLLHIPTAMYYWFLVYGTERQPWFMPLVVNPIPVPSYALFIILAATMAIGHLYNEYINPIWMPVVSRGVAKTLPRIMTWLPHETHAGADADTFTLVSRTIGRLTGAKVAMDSDLHAIGVDSFGATALVGALRTAIPAAASLRPAAVLQMHTVEELVQALDEAAGIETSHDLEGVAVL